MTHSLLPERPDVLYRGRAPKHIRKWLMNAGGVTPWGENRYRLVLAECVMLYVGAKWHDWAPNADLLDQGGLEFSGVRKSKYVMRDPTDHSKTIEIEADVPASVGIKKNTPERVIAEMRAIPRYSDIKGWLLQVWYPSSYYSKEHYDIHVDGRPDLPLLGEFPAKGQYERQFFYAERGLDGQLRKSETFPTMPGESWMERAIQSNERAIAKRGGSTDPNSIEVAWRTMRAMEEVMEARQVAAKQARDKFEAQVKDSIAPIFSNSLEGGRIREELARKCRVKGIAIGHVGN